MRAPRAAPRARAPPARAPRARARAPPRWALRTRPRRRRHRTPCRRARPAQRAAPAWRATDRGSASTPPTPPSKHQDAVAVRRHFRVRDGQGGSGVHLHADRPAGHGEAVTARGGAAREEYGGLAGVAHPEGAVGERGDRAPAAKVGAGSRVRGDRQADEVRAGVVLDGHRGLITEPVTDVSSASTWDCPFTMIPLPPGARVAIPLSTASLPSPATTMADDATSRTTVFSTTFPPPDVTTCPRRGRCRFHSRARRWFLTPAPGQRPTLARRPGSRRVPPRRSARRSPAPRHPPRTRRAPTGATPASATIALPPGAWMRTLPASASGAQRHRRGDDEFFLVRAGRQADQRAVRGVPQGIGDGAVRARAVLRDEEGLPVTRTRVHSRRGSVPAGCRSARPAPSAVPCLLPRPPTQPGPSPGRPAAKSSSGPPGRPLPARHSRSRGRQLAEPHLTPLPVAHLEHLEARARQEHHLAGTSGASTLVRRPGRRPDQEVHGYRAAGRRRRRAPGRMPIL